MPDQGRRKLLVGGAAWLAGCASAPTAVAPPPVPPSLPPVQPPAPLRIGLALGGGAARGFAHIGVIKALEAQGIVADVVAGTSAGSLVGALYAAGNNGFELHRLALAMDESTITDWMLPLRGVFRGEALQGYVNRIVGNRPIEKLGKPFGAVATDLKSGEAIVFQRGNVGMAVRASSSVPGLFQPVTINGREYVDGGLVSPVPVKAARGLGADFVIAVDLSPDPSKQETSGTLDVLLQTFAIMSNGLKQVELPTADVVIRPQLDAISSADFQARNHAILAGEQAAAGAMANLKSRLEARRRSR